MESGANRLKSNKPLTEAFLKEHRLERHAYPAAATYAEIVKASSSDGTFYLDRDKYQRMCAKREKHLIATLIKAAHPKAAQKPGSTA